MAKTVSVSSDNRSTWFTLPGSSGGFNSSAEPVNDTVFGQTYESNEITLISWAVSANAFYKGFAGYLVKILKPGTPTAATGEAFSQESGQIYAIDTVTRQIWDRSVAIVVLDGTTNVVAQVEWYDYLFGRLKFLDAYSVVGAITADITYLPTTTLANGQSYNLTMNANAIQNTTFAIAQANSGHHTFEPGLRTVNLELSGVYSAAENARAALVTRAELILEIDAAGDTLSIARGFFKYADVAQTGDVGALEDETLNFALTVPDDTLMLTPFSWQHDGTTTLSQAVRICLDAFLDETLIDVRYLPTGVEGVTPDLDGKEGDCIVTDISMSGGLTDMNTFTVALQGSGIVTEV